MWSDAKVRALSDDGKLAFLFVLTHPSMTMVGAMRTTLPGLAAELDWPAARMKKALQEAFRKGMLQFDPKACFLWAPHFLRYNPPASPNVVVSWQKVIADLPDSHLKPLLLQEVKDFLDTLTQEFRDALPEAIRKALLNQKQKQKQKQKQEKEQKPEQNRSDPACSKDINRSGRGESEGGEGRAGVFQGDLAGPDREDRTAVERWTMFFLVELCKAFGLTGDQPVRQRRSFRRVAANVLAASHPNETARQLVDLAREKQADGQLDKPIAAWQKQVNEILGK